jgi:hypothetical protein
MKVCGSTSKGPGRLVYRSDIRHHGPERAEAMTALSFFPVCFAEPTLQEGLHASNVLGCDA